jgi:hypothetical protein
MLVSHLRKQSHISTPSHAVYYDDKKKTFNTHSLECTTCNTLQMRSQLHHDRQIHIRCYNRKHIMLQQSTFSHDFGVDPRLNFPAIRGDTETATDTVVDVLRVNIITHISSCNEFGSPLINWSRIGLEGASYTYSFEQKCICLMLPR